MKTITITLPEIDDIKFNVYDKYEFDDPKDHFASGDDESDLKIVNDIRERLKSNQWAWCTVKVTGSYKGMCACDYLGACSYLSKEDFMNDVYYEDMKKTVYNDIIDQLKRLQ